jgi:micrococcal nuclease
MNTKKYSIQLNRVIDGDSLDIDIDLGFGIVLQNRRLRLEGVDTPELRTSDEEEKQFGLRAKSFVVDWCSKRNLNLVVKNHGDEYDKFGRILGQVEDNEGNNLVTDIISNYHGVAYHGQNKADIRKAHMNNRAKLFTI